MRKAFTLIELLAVIVILSVIAFISFPLVMNVINNAKEKSDMISIEQILKSAKMYYTTNKADESVELNRDVNVLSNLDYQSSKGVFGNVFVSKSGNIKMELVYNDKCYTKLFSEENIYVSTNLDDCGEIVYSPINPEQPAEPSKDYVPLTPELCFTTSTEGESVDLENFAVADANSCELLFSYLSPNKSDVEKFCDGTGTINGLSITQYITAITSGVIGDSTGIKTSLLSSDAFTGVEKVNNLEITGYKCYTGNTGGYTAINSLNIPKEINEQKVYSIADGAFKDKGITSVKINDGLAAINYQAFKGNNLTKLDLPSTIVAIGEEAFQGNKISTLNLNDGLVTIGMNAFNGNKLKTLKLSDSITTLGTSAFSNNLLTNVDFNDNIKTIGTFAFLKNAITSLDIPSTASIGAGAFNNNQMPSDKAYITNSNDTSTIVSYGGSNKDIVLTGYSKVGDSAFAYCDLKSVEVTNDVKNIGKEAFAYNNLTNVIINNQMQSIGSKAFYRTSTSNPNMNKITYKYTYYPMSMLFDWYDIVTGVSGKAKYEDTVVSLYGITSVAKS